MWLFLGSECLLFGGLISTYMLYRGRHAGEPRPGPGLRHPVHLGVELFVLLMCSLTMVLAVSAAQRRDDRNTRLWLVGHRAARRDVRRRPGLRVHAFYREGLGFTTSLFARASTR